MKKKLLFWIPNGLLLLMMVGSGVMYFASPAQVAEVFTQLQYPVYTMYFNATAKILGGIAIAFPFPRVLKDFAYAGYLYIILLALQATYMTMPLQNVALMPAFVVLWALAYWSYVKLGQTR